MTKCIIKDCNNEVEDPARYIACNAQHGYKWKNIKEAIKKSERSYIASPFNRFNDYLSDEELTHYREQL